MPQVAVAAADGAFGGGHGDAPLPGVADGIFPGTDFPLPPGRDDFQPGVQGHVGEFEADLVVAFARGTVGHRVRAFLPGDFHLVLGNEGPGNGRAQHVLALVHRAGAQQAEEVLLREFVLEVFDDEFAGAALERLLFQALQFLALAQVRGEADDFAVVVFLQPRHDDGGVQAAGVGQDHLFDVFARFSFGHIGPPFQEQDGVMLVLHGLDK